MILVLESCISNLPTKKWDLVFLLFMCEVKTFLENNKTLIVKSFGICIFFISYNKKTKKNLVILLRFFFRISLIQTIYIEMITTLKLHIFSNRIAPIKQPSQQAVDIPKSILNGRLLIWHNLKSSVFTISWHLQHVRKTFGEILWSSHKTKTATIMVLSLCKYPWQVLYKYSTQNNLNTNLECNHN